MPPVHRHHHHRYGRLVRRKIVVTPAASRKQRGGAALAGLVTGALASAGVAALGKRRRRVEVPVTEVERAPSYDSVDSSPSG